MNEIVSIKALLGIVPFVVLLGMLATGPVLYPHFWHRYYAVIATCLGIGVLGYYALVLHNIDVPIHAVADYVQFIALIGALYVAAGGIFIEVHFSARPMTNLLFLWGGAVLSNLIGTTGASMLLIRPYIRLNGAKVRAYHIVFFIFIVSNVGGSLTPFADPPNFIGFLKGVPFFWTVEHNFLPWLLALVGLSIVFYALERYHGRGIPADEGKGRKGGRWVTLRGFRNIGWLALIVMAIFVDRNIMPWIPAIPYAGHHFSFVREVLLLILGWASYRYADKALLKENGFSFEPLKEVVFVFIGIFGTMMPALALIDALARSPLGQKAVTPHMLYWCTGCFSSILDNLPTYFSFLTAGMASRGFAVDEVKEVGAYAQEAVAYLRATSLAAVFFGAMTYMGNGPNFMVRSIAAEQKIKMPSFGGYIVRYSVPFLLPILVLTWWFFFC